MEEQIRLLNNHLLTLRPDYYDALNAPLNDAELDKLEDYYKIKLPEDLRALYKWKNGQNPDSYEAFVNNSEFVPLHQALYDAAELNGMIGSDFEIENWWNAHWIPIFQNGGGDSICYDLKGIFTGQAGQLIEFWHADNDRNVIAPTLETFLAKLNDFYQSTTPEAFDDYFTVARVEGYPKKFILE